MADKLKEAEEKLEARVSEVAQDAQKSLAEAKEELQEKITDLTSTVEENRQQAADDLAKLDEKTAE